MHIRAITGRRRKGSAIVDVPRLENTHLDKDKHKDDRKQEPGRCGGETHLTGDGEGIDENGEGDHLRASLRTAVGHDIHGGKHLERADDGYDCNMVVSCL